MVDRDDDKAVRCECCAEPSEIGRRTAETVGQENQRTPGPCRMRRIARGAASAIERKDGRPDPLRFLARLGCGRIPDRCAECVCLGTAPVVWFDWDKILRSDADLEDAVGPRENHRREED